jgi:hypothetical protein
LTEVTNGKISPNSTERCCSTTRKPLTRLVDIAAKISKQTEDTLALTITTNFDVSLVTPCECNVSRGKLTDFDLTRVNGLSKRLAPSFFLALLISLLTGGVVSSP